MIKDCLPLNVICINDDSVVHFSNNNNEKSEGKLSSSFVGVVVV